MKSRENIEFQSYGITYRGWLYLGDKGMRPRIVMAHGFGGFNEMRLDAQLIRLQAKGIM